MSDTSKHREALALPKLAVSRTEKSPPKLRGGEAEGKGFEPLVHYCTTVFKTAAFDRSAIPPLQREGTLFPPLPYWGKASTPTPRCPRVASVSVTLPENVFCSFILGSNLE